MRKFRGEKHNKILFIMQLQHLWFSHLEKFSEKVCEIRTKIFAFFRENFCLLETCPPHLNFMLLTRNGT